MGPDGSGEVDGPARGRIVDYLRDAVVELEVWRQNARSAEERQSLHRVTALLNLASSELRSGTGGTDPNQQSLHLAAIQP
jgi:hypothetical protein